MKPLIFFVTTVVAVSCGNVRSGQRQSNLVRNAREDLQLLSQGLNLQNQQGSSGLTHEQKINFARQGVNLPLPSLPQQIRYGQNYQQNLLSLTQPTVNILPATRLNLEQQNDVRINEIQQNQDALKVNLLPQEQSQLEIGKELINETPFTSPEFQQNNLISGQQQDTHLLNLGSQQRNLENQQLVLPQPQQINLGQPQLNIDNQVQISQINQQQPLQSLNIEAQQLNQKQGQLEVNQAAQKLASQQQQLQLLNFQTQSNAIDLQPTVQPQVTIQPQLSIVNLPQTQLGLLHNLPRINLQQLDLSLLQQQPINIQQPQISIQPTQLPQLQLSTLQPAQQTVFNIQNSNPAPQQQFNIPEPIDIPRPQLNVQPTQLPQIQLQPTQQTLLNIQQSDQAPQSVDIPHSQVTIQPTQQTLLNIPQHQLNIQQPQLNIQQQQLNFQPTQFPQLQVTTLGGISQTAASIPQPTPAPQQQFAQQQVNLQPQVQLNRQPVPVPTPLNIPQSIPQPIELNIPRQEVANPQLNLLQQQLNIPQPQLNIQPQPQQPSGPQQIRLSIPQVQNSPQQQKVNIEANVQQLEPIIHKHVYFHVAPEEPEPVVPVQPTIVSRPKIHYKIIFIKAPNPQPIVPKIVAPQVQQEEEKTIVYVLVKKPESPEILLPPPAPTTPSKPEVFFIKYRAQQDAQQGAQAENSGGEGVPILEEAIKKVEDASIEPRLLNNGESIVEATLSTTAAPVYGPPGYKKRNS